MDTLAWTIFQCVACATHIAPQRPHHPPTLLARPTWTTAPWPPRGQCPPRRTRGLEAARQCAEPPPAPPPAPRMRVALMGQPRPSCEAQRPRGMGPSYCHLHLRQSHPAAQFQTPPPAASAPRCHGGPVWHSPALQQRATLVRPSCPAAAAQMHQRLLESRQRHPCSEHGLQATAPLPKSLPRGAPPHLLPRQQLPLHQRWQQSCPTESAAHSTPQYWSERPCRRPRLQCPVLSQLWRAAWRGRRP
mmetsp:Transcript_15789/g.50300  ORF Transcript_15789/g.50300 Transcript_15789/m.50300 type:complete len:246 (+) Transcript_15789:349-1086(+)